MSKTYEIRMAFGTPGQSVDALGANDAILKFFRGMCTSGWRLELDHSDFWIEVWDTSRSPPRLEVRYRDVGTLMATLKTMSSDIVTRTATSLRFEK